MEIKQFPKDWKKMKLIDISESISAGGTPRRNKSEYWDNGTIPWLKISDMKNRYISKTKEKITKEGLKNSSTKLFPVGTLVYSIFATLGAIGILKIESTTNQAIVGIIPKRNLIDTNYLYYCLIYSKDSITAKKSHATQDNLNLTILKNHEILVPPLQTQKQIVSILEKAEILKQKREKSDKLTKEYLLSVFFDMFGDPDSNQKKLEVVPIGKYAKFQGGFAFKSKDFRKEGIKLVKITNVHYNKLIWEDINYLPENYLERYEDFVLKNEDIVMSMTRPIIKSLDFVKIVRINKNDLPCLLNQRVGRFMINKKYLNETYLLYFCYSDYFKREVNKYCSTSLQPNISSTQVESIKIPLSPLLLQNKFASIVEEVEKLKEKQKQSKEELNQMFDSLMKQAFNGELIK